MSDQTNTQPEQAKATVKFEERPITLLRPTVRAKVDGKTVTATCTHDTYWHWTEKQAQACARKLAAELGAQL